MHTLTDTPTAMLQRMGHTATQTRINVPHVVHTKPVITAHHVRQFAVQKLVAFLGAYRLSSIPLAASSPLHHFFLNDVRPLFTSVGHFGFQQQQIVVGHVLQPGVQIVVKVVLIQPDSPISFSDENVSFLQLGQQPAVILREPHHLRAPRHPLTALTHR